MGFTEEAVHHHDSLAVQPVMQTRRVAFCTNSEHLMFTGGGIFKQFQKHSDNTCYLDTKSKQWVKETPCWPHRATIVWLCWGVHLHRWQYLLEG